MTEQSLLKFSIAVTVLLAAFGIGAGLFSGSFAVVFDGPGGLSEPAFEEALWDRIQSLSDQRLSLTASVVQRENGRSGQTVGMLCSNRGEAC